MSITFTDNTVTPLSIQSGSTLNLTKDISVADSNPLTTVETVIVNIQPSGDASLTNSNPGAFIDPNGGGAFNGPTDNAAFVESGLIAGDPPFATNLLHRLVWNVPTLKNGQSAEFKITITVQDSPPLPPTTPLVSTFIPPANTITQSITDPKTIIVDVVTPPAITGTVVNQPFSPNIKPFATTVITDNDFNQKAQDTATIIVTDGGAPTDADGTLVGAGISETSTGTYTIAATSPDKLTSILQSLSFASPPDDSFAPGQPVAPHFELDVTDVPQDNEPALTSKDTTTSIFSRTPVDPVLPTITGTQSGQMVNGSAIQPFTSVVLGDKNFIANDDTLTIIVRDSKGNPTDANGKLTGNPLTLSEKSPGVYTLGTPPFAVTPVAIQQAGGLVPFLNGELKALTFQPSGVSGTTTLEIDLKNNKYGLTGTDSTTSVVTKGPSQALPNPPFIPPTTPARFDITDTSQTPNTHATSAGEQYDGTVPNLDWQLIEPASFPDGLNITALVPNVFIHGGSEDDALDMKGLGGTNVLDGSTGSNFLTGGTSHNTFFLDDRSPSKDVWTTVKGMHTGDDAVIWGITQTDFQQMTEADNVLAIAPGLDFSLIEPGKSIINLTLSDYTTADLPKNMGGNGRLSIDFGHTPDLPGLPGSDYMQIHAN